MTTARDIVKAALRKIHVLGQGASLSGELADNGFKALNRMIATWSVQGNMIYSEQFETFPLVGGQSTYTLGAGGDFDTTRVTRISSAYVTQGQTDYIMTRWDKDDYASIPQKDLNGGIPRIFYFDAGFPLSTIRLYHTPGGVSTITLVDETILDQFTDLDTEFSMPPEYEDALIYNLALRMAPEYEREPSRSVRQIAYETKAAVKIQNSKNDKHRSSIDVPSRSRGYRSDIHGGYC